MNQFIPSPPTRLGLTALASLLACLLGCAGAQAADFTPEAGFVQLGAGASGDRMGSAGLVWPWAWRSEMGGGLLTAYTEAYVSRWSANSPAGRKGYTQLAVSPMLRYRFDGGRSSWFLEGGIGLSWLDGAYVSGGDVFSTRWNFVDSLGLGRSFGEGGKQELGLRLVHVSNASIRRPNPGEEFVQLRYTWKF